MKVKSRKASQQPIFLAEQLMQSMRILVLGSSGSGKSYLTRQLSNILNTEPIHLDAHFVQPGWKGMPDDEWRTVLSSLIKKERWIMDGTYERTLDLRLPAADTIIIIESSRLACLWRVLIRKITVDDSTRPDAPPGQRLDRPFLRYIWQYPKATRALVFRYIQESGQNKMLILLNGTKDIKKLLEHARTQVEDKVLGPVC